MKPLNHAKGSAKRYGGIPDDYLEIHTFMDSSKSAYADVRHRAILHNSLGPFIAEKAFGYYLTNSEGKKISVRQIVEDHIVEDLGFIPSVEHWLKTMPRLPWMDVVSNAKHNKKKITWKEWNNDNVD